MVFACINSYKGRNHDGFDSFSDDHNLGRILLFDCFFLSNVFLLSCLLVVAPGDRLQGLFFALSAPIQWGLFKNILTYHIVVI